MTQVFRLSDRQMAARVKLGACLLDKHRPGWEWEVDLRRLGGLENDVLSQLYGDYSAAMEVLGFGSVREQLDHLSSETPSITFRGGNVGDYGFAAFREDGGGNWREAYQELRRLWRGEAKTRQEQGGEFHKPATKWSRLRLRTSYCDSELVVPKFRFLSSSSMLVLVDQPAEDVATFQPNHTLALGKVGTGIGSLEIESPMGAERPHSAGYSTATPAQRGAGQIGVLAPHTAAPFPATTTRSHIAVVFAAAGIAPTAVNDRCGVAGELRDGVFCYPAVG